MARGRRNLGGAQAVPDGNRASHRGHGGLPGFQRRPSTVATIPRPAPGRTGRKVPHCAAHRPIGRPGSRAGLTGTKASVSRAWHEEPWCVTAGGRGSPMGVTHRIAGHRTVPHTADLRIEAWAPTREECLAEAVRGLVDSFAAVAGRCPHHRASRHMTARPDADLLVAVIDEVIYRLDADGEIPVWVQARPAADGAPRAPARHRDGRQASGQECGRPEAPSPGPPGVVRLQPARLPGGAVHRLVRYLDGARPAVQSRSVRA